MGRECMRKKRNNPGQNDCETMMVSVLIEIWKDARDNVGIGEFLVRDSEANKQM